MNQPHIITARFSGTCAKTGKRYPAGTPLVKGATGWQIAPAVDPAAVQTRTNARPPWSGKCEFCGCWRKDGVCIGCGHYH